MKTTNFFRKTIAVLLAILMLCFTQSAVAFAASEYTYENFTYTVSSGNAVIISYPETAKGEVKIPSSINGYTVTAIDDYAFFGCTVITSVTIPNTIKSIGTYAFGYCMSLENVYYEGSQTDWNKITISNGNDYLVNAEFDFNSASEDTTKPTGTIFSTNDVASKQTVTLSLWDDVSLEGYYWGTSSNYLNNEYTRDSGLFMSRISKTVSYSGTYYLTVVDTSGNVSDTTSVTFYKTTLNANGGSVSPTSVLTKSGNSFTFPTPTSSKYVYEGWSTSSSATSGVKTLKPTGNKTYYAVWNKYNLGEETYSFDNYVDSDSAGGHCFGMSITSSGYYLGQLNPSIIGIANSKNLHTVSDNSTVRTPICTYQAIQGSYRDGATVAGGSYYLTRVYDIQSDWQEVVDYVRNHEYDHTGALQIGFRQGDSGHAINFLRYEVVDGEERIYAYDNNTPEIETYFYMDSGNVFQAPESEATFFGAIDCIALRDVQTYYNLVQDFDESNVLYGSEDSVFISEALAYPMESDNAPYSMFEIPSDVEQITIIPLVDNATFTYLGQTYNFGNIDEDTVGILKLAEDSSTDCEFEITSIKVNSVSVDNISMNYMDSTTITPMVEVDGDVDYTVTYSSSNTDIVSVDENGRVTTNGTGSAEITVTVTDEFGNTVTDTCDVEVSYTWWQWIIVIVLFGWIWY